MPTNKTNQKSNIDLNPNLKTLIGVHSKLAIAVLKTKNANIQYAFAIWAIFRSYEGWFYTYTQILVIAQKSTKSSLTINKWLLAGEGIFWNKGINKSTNEVSYYWIGKDKVFKYFELTSPGKVLTIYIDDLINPKLSALRANLKDCVITKKCKWASRETLEELTGVPRRTQQIYDNQSGIYRQYTYEVGSLSVGDKEYEVKQKPTIYYGRFAPHHQKTNFHRYGLYISDNIKVAGEIKPIYTGRLLHDDSLTAYNKAVQMQNKDIGGHTYYKKKLTNKGDLLIGTIVPGSKEFNNFVS